jgi:regulator of protease activity HflC (stomatin/prohibitin superfamily)
MGPLLIALLVLAVIVFFSSYVIVHQQTVALVERFGKFQRTLSPGLNLKIPIIETVRHRMNMRVQQLDVGVETKTEDDVFVHLKVSVQYMVMPDKVFEAYYKLNNVTEQIRSYIFDVVRARVPTQKLDDVFSHKDEIADAVKSELQITMNEFGYNIIKALVTDIEPDARVRDAMNAINAATRERIAASEKGEAERILKVKAAQADAESKALQGKGIADQRRAIVDGLRNSVEEFRTAVPGTSAVDVMTLVLMTQYFDTLKEVSDRSRTNTIMIPSTPGGVASLTEQIREALLSTQAATQPQTPPKHT